MRLLLDTVTFLWGISSPSQLSRKAMSALQNESTVREISAISLSEIVFKSARGKLTFVQSDLNVGIASLRLRVLPYTAAHAFRLFDLPPHHADPFDPQIIAQALAEDIPVAASDETFRLYKGLKVIW